MDRGAGSREIGGGKKGGGQLKGQGLGEGGQKPHNGEDEECILLWDRGKQISKQTLRLEERVRTAEVVPPIELSQESGNHIRALGAGAQDCPKESVNYPTC